MKVGRPKFVVDFEAVERLAAIMCTVEEIASVLGCHRDTLYQDPKFSDIFKRGQENGKASLRRRQFAMAENNPTLLIWLGKQYLGQKDIQTVEQTGPNGGPLQIVATAAYSVEDLQRLEEIMSKAEINGEVLDIKDK